MMQKKEDLFHLLYDYTYLAGRDHFETSPLCDKDGTHRLNPYHTQESFLNVFVYNVLLDFPFEHAISFLREKWKSTSPRRLVF